jgi:hypothetical protein
VTQSSRTALEIFLGIISGSMLEQVNRRNLITCPSYFDARLHYGVHIMSESFDTNESDPVGSNSQRKFLRILMIFIIIAIIIVLALGAIVVFQTKDLWFDTQPKTLDPSEIEGTATAACEDFIQEFPGTPCP